MEAGVEINGRFYPVPTGFTLGEARTIKRLTGLGLVEYAEALSRIDEDPDVMTAFIWLAMHRDDPKVTVEQVEQIESVSLKFISPEPRAEEKPKAGDDEDPPSMGGQRSDEPRNAVPAPSEASAPTSNGSPESSWARSPAFSGPGL